MDRESWDEVALPQLRERACVGTVISRLKVRAHVSCAQDPAFVLRKRVPKFVPFPGWFGFELFYVTRSISFATGKAYVNLLRSEWFVFFIPRALGVASGVYSSLLFIVGHLARSAFGCKSRTLLKRNGGRELLKVECGSEESDEVGRERVLETLWTTQASKYQRNVLQYLERNEIDAGDMQAPPIFTHAVIVGPLRVGSKSALFSNNRSVGQIRTKTTSAISNRTGQLCSSRCDTPVASQVKEQLPSFSQYILRCISRACSKTLVGHQIVCSGLGFSQPNRTLSRRKIS